MGFFKRTPEREYSQSDRWRWTEDPDVYYINQDLTDAWIDPVRESFDKYFPKEDQARFSYPEFVSRMALELADLFWRLYCDRDKQNRILYYPVGCWVQQIRACGSDERMISHRTDYINNMIDYLYQVWGAEEFRVQVRGCGASAARFVPKLP